MRNDFPAKAERAGRRFAFVGGSMIPGALIPIGGAIAQEAGEDADFVAVDVGDSSVRQDADGVLIVTPPGSDPVLLQPGSYRIVDGRLEVLSDLAPSLDFTTSYDVWDYLSGVTLVGAVGTILTGATTEEVSAVVVSREPREPVELTRVVAHDLTDASRNFENNTAIEVSRAFSGVANEGALTTYGATLDGSGGDLSVVGLEISGETGDITGNFTGAMDIVINITASNESGTVMQTTTLTIDVNHTPELVEGVELPDIVVVYEPNMGVNVEVDAGPRFMDRDIMDGDGMDDDGMDDDGMDGDGMDGDGMDGDGMDGDGMDGDGMDGDGMDGDGMDGDGMDDDGEALTYTAAARVPNGFPSELSSVGLAIDESTGMITGSFTGRVDTTILVRATDKSGTSVSDTFVIRVNIPPGESDVPLTNRSVAPGIPIPVIDVSGAFRDVNGDGLTFGVEFDPAMDSGLAFDGAREISGMLTNLGDSVTVTVTARDGRGGVGMQDFTITAVTFGMPTGANDVLDGDNVDNEIDGGSGNDVINGMGGNDTLIGGIGDDTLTGGAGNDTLNGGDDADRAVYDGDSDDFAIGAERIYEADGTSEIWHAILDLEVGEEDEGLDMLLGIEILQFSNEDMDINVEDIERVYSIRGSASDDNINGESRVINGIEGANSGETISGLGGSDRIEGGRGNDRIHGHSFGGYDWPEDIDVAVFKGDIREFRFENGGGSPRGIIVTDTKADNGDEGRDILVGIERMEFGDGVIIETSNVFFDGEDGSLTGGDGGDVLYAPGGGYTLTGGAGGDIFQFLFGRDSPTGFSTTITDFNRPPNENGDGDETGAGNGDGDGTGAGNGDGDGTGAGNGDGDGTDAGNGDGDGADAGDRDGERGDRIALGQGIGPVMWREDEMEGHTILENTDSGFRLVIDGIGHNLTEGNQYYYIGVDVDTPDPMIRGDRFFPGSSRNDRFDSDSFGDNLLDGGGGVDTAVYAGNFSDFIINVDFHDPDRLVVTDRNISDGIDEGRDELVNIERIEFNDFHVDTIDINRATRADLIGNDDPGNGLFYGQGGGYVFTGGAGNDLFQFLTYGDSTRARPTVISDFFRGDKIVFGFGDTDDIYGIRQNDYTYFIQSRDNPDFFVVVLLGKADDIVEDRDYVFIHSAVDDESPARQSSEKFALIDEEHPVALRASEESRTSGILTGDNHPGDDMLEKLYSTGETGRAGISDFPSGDDDMDYAGIAPDAAVSDTRGDERPTYAEIGEMGRIPDDVGIAAMEIGDYLFFQ